ncbi:MULTISPECIES: hypothetical protein [Agrobacterium]|nr:hypothetical protein [Agrobacterium fabrum]
MINNAGNKALYRYAAQPASASEPLMNILAVDTKHPGDASEITMPLRKD